MIFILSFIIGLFEATMVSEMGLLQNSAIVENNQTFKNTNKNP